MGGGDLNLKKSWHPMLMSNQKRVWEEEQKALAERKKIDQMMKERAEERNLQELQQLQEAAGGTQRRQRVDWMYSGPSSGQAGTTEEMEGYLLGKRRIDGLIKGTENQQLQKSAKAEESFMAVQNANTARDTAAKIREDPMLAIKRQEQAAYEAMMNDPIRRKMLLKAAGQEDGERDHKRRKRDHHHRRHREADDNGADSRVHRSHSHRHRRSDKRSREERSPHRRHSTYSNEDRTRRRSPRKSASPARPSRSFAKEGRGESATQSQSRSRSRSRSPYRPRRAENGSRRSYNRPEDRDHGRGRSRSKSASRSPPRRRSSPQSTKKSRNDNGDVAARLAAMQQDAQSLDEQRQRRLQEMAERDRVEDTRLDAERAHNAKYGGRATFVDRLHKQAGGISLGERIGRGGQKLAREDD